jgi:hypothetical protein
MTGNYRCFLARSLIVILGYVNFTYTSNNSILPSDIIRWIKETFLMKGIKVSCTNIFITFFFIFFVYIYFLLVVKFNMFVKPSYQTTLLSYCTYL